MRLHDRLLVLVYLVLAALPVLAMALEIKGRPLYGSLPPTPRPALELDAILAEKYQHELTGWFESNLGLKGTSIALDNAILHHVFRETRFGSTVHLGKDGVLFPADDISFFNKHGRQIADPAYIDRLAAQMATLQRRLSARGRALVPVLIPSKTSIWRDQIPDRWKQDLPEPRHADELTRLVREALARHRVKYVDAVELLQRAAVSRNDLFGPDARHWTIYGACLAMREAATLYAELTGKPRPPHECELARQGPRRHDDHDMMRLLNTMWVYRGYKRQALVHHAPPPPDWGPKPSMLVTATSFGWTMMFDAEDSGLYGPIHLNYYNKTFAAQDGARTEVQAGSPSWRAIVMETDYHVLDLFESYLAAPDAYVETFLRDILAEIGEAPAPR
ncbi:MAG TPA: hypothetical protein VK932_12355 [Kofleriaceae bacterium]|nr:hypothetical protein [Kofleriaceae bacterium]